MFGPDDKTTYEHDTYRCNHCQFQVHVPPKCDPADLGGMCFTCNKLICAACDEKKWNGELCVTVEERLQREEAAYEARRSYG